MWLRDATHVSGPNCLPCIFFCCRFLLKVIPFWRDFQWHLWRSRKRTFASHRRLSNPAAWRGRHGSLLCCIQRVNNPYNLCLIHRNPFRVLVDFHVPQSAQSTTYRTFSVTLSKTSGPVRRFLLRYENKHKTLCRSRAMRRKTATSWCLLLVK